MPTRSRRASLAPLSGRIALKCPIQGLKPLPESCGPFGAEITGLQFLTVTAMRGCQMPGYRHSVPTGHQSLVSARSHFDGDEEAKALHQSPITNHFSPMTWGASSAKIFS
jgi:hypothetical protein